MTDMTRLRSALAILGIALGPVVASAQLQTEAPPPVPGAKPVNVERIKVHGAALEGNLEGNAADRDVLVVLPPSYAKEKSRSLRRRLCAARVFDRRRAMVTRDPRAPDR